VFRLIFYTLCVKENRILSSRKTHQAAQSQTAVRPCSVHVRI